MKKRLMAVLLCVCMAAVLLTPYASVLTADGALRLGIAGAENGQDLTGESSSTSTEGGEEAESAETLKEEAPEATATAEPEATATTAPEATATTAPEATKAPAPKYTLDSNRAVYKDGATLRGEPKDCVVKASYSVALAYTDPTDRSEAKTYAAGDRVRVYDEIQYEDCDGAERKWSVVLDGSDFYFVLSEALESAPELPAQAPAQTDMKSLFGIGDNVNPANIINPNTAVRTYVFMYNGKEISRQSVKDGDTLEPVTAPVGANEQFVKWVIKDTETEVTFGEVSGVDKTEEVTVTAVVKTVYTVYFKTEDGSLVLDTRQGTTGDKIDDFDKVDVSKKYQLGADESVVGWQDENGTTVEFVTIENKDITLTAKIDKGYWITFNSNGGSYVAPVFKATGEKLDLTTIVPTRTGYTFDGWYNNAAFTGDKVTVVSDVATLYAKWEPNTANLTVIFWYENANDDGYSLAGTLETTAVPETVKNSVDYKDENFDGKVLAEHKHFTYNADKAEDVTVKGDGSTVLDVYYTRNTYTLTFPECGAEELKCGKVEHKHSNSCCKYGGTSITHWGHNRNCCKFGLPTHTHDNSCYKYADLTIKAKYDSDITSVWKTDPIKSLLGQGYVFQSSVTGKYYSFLEKMPGQDITMTKTLWSGSTYEWYYYLEVPEGMSAPAGATTRKDGGKTYYLYHTVTVKGSSTLSLTYDEDYYPITGFTQRDKDVPDFDNNNKAYLYYTRNTYELKFINYGSTVKTATKYYQADISGENINPDYPTTLEANAYTFDAWYTDQYSSEEGKFNFDGATMPAGPVILYAHWVPKTFIVTVYDADGKTKLATFNIPLGNKISEEKMPKVKPNGSDEFLGWVNMEGDKPFNFDTEIRKDYNLYALVGSKDGYTVTYDKNGGEGTAPVDPNKKYAAGTKATVLDKGGLTHPEGKFFLGWATNKDATRAEYRPGDTMPIAANITLYAVWGDKPATTTLTYNANYGADPETVKHKENNSEDLLNNAEVTLYTAKQADFTRDGYDLIGWNTNQAAANEGTVQYEPGDKVIVDTKDITAGANILYAVWRQSTTTVTVKKIVVGPMGDRTRAFKFEYSLDKGETWTKLNDAGLKHDDSETIEGVAIGSTLLIREEKVTNYTVAAGSSVQDKTTITVAADSNGFTLITVPSVAASETITVTNTNTLVPDTGVILDSLPYVLILAVVALGAAGVVIRRRRHREDD